MRTRALLSGLQAVPVGFRPRRTSELPFRQWQGIATDPERKPRDAEPFDLPVWKMPRATDKISSNLSVAGSAADLHDGDWQASARNLAAEPDHGPEV